MKLFHSNLVMIIVLVYDFMFRKFPSVHVTFPSLCALKTAEE